MKEIQDFQVGFKLKKRLRYGLNVSECKHTHTWNENVWESKEGIPKTPKFNSHIENKKLQDVPKLESRFAKLDLV
jgi:hypothetical protein